MNPTILKAGILPTTSFTIGGSSQQLAYNIGVNPVTVPQDNLHVLSIILQIISPSGYVMYVNAGWPSNFSSPDSLTGTIDLPFLTGTSTPESGIYLINIQAQYVDSTSTPVTTLATVNYASADVCVSCLPAPSLNRVLNCTDVLLTITDVTNYLLSGYTTGTISRTITAIPPAGSNQPTATGTAKVLQIDNGSEGNGALWNGLYSLSLVSTATYIQGSTTIVQSLSYTSPTSGPNACIVSCLDPRCTIWCELDLLNTKYINQLTFNPALAKSQTLPQLLAGTAELLLINQAIECGQPFSSYITNFWTVTGLNPDCGCGCVDETATGAVMPIGCGCTGSGGGSGAPGTGPGSVWRSGSGVPSNSLGLNNDMYLDNATGNVYQKLSGVYVLQCNITGPSGAAGSIWRNGTGVPSNSLGINGDYYIDNATGNYYQKSTGAYSLIGNFGSNEAVSVLWNPFVDYTNTGTGAGDVVTRTIPATAFVTPSNVLLGGDEVDLLISGNITVGPSLIIVSIGGENVALIGNSSATLFTLSMQIVYTSSTNLRVDGEITYFDPNTYLPTFNSLLSTKNVSYTAGDTVAVEIDFSALSASGDAVLEFIKSINYKQ